jgi:hypothetical protein
MTSTIIPKKQNSPRSTPFPIKDIINNIDVVRSSKLSFEFISYVVKLCFHKEDYVRVILSD